MHEGREREMVHEGREREMVHEGREREMMHEGREREMDGSTKLMSLGPVRRTNGVIVKFDPVVGKAAWAVEAITCEECRAYTLGVGSTAAGHVVAAGHTQPDGSLAPCPQAFGATLA